ncbi:MFS transporter [Burkholderia pseudomultivorans]|uniref:MFS transporter n=1 Tax=Burkholderia pseudomultivorans TaxID=1207504 RepID=A0A132EIF3_9BURK|nr:MFS transporter [Burkholderia pseudomultivorans]KWF30902.1 MFS transporter [Burkholderia pseudomultivorans]MDR8726802.1 Multidrug export protein EmrB [Burkholderia pseudomultivorans]MDR8736093.1 Multidrug export protein EmrB [Burkholderia pseudomultivorans]MDR8742069.1 Multidrug export protein EmrB [Burkholderia pseudomultivorans]MDR8753132.1 Multidrug export protein EmrB [Burkholderia pseudomultivorans]
MNASPARQPLRNLARLQDDLFPLAIAIATGLDYFDNASFSFFTSYIAGGINASPDELVWAASAYAVASVLGILQQQWWVERLGYRRYVSGSLLLFAAASVAAALSESSLELAVARGVQGYFMGPMMSACRILLQISFTPQRRGAATRQFLTMILLGSALAPLIGGYLVAHFGWRAVFLSTATGGCAIAAFTLFAVPPSGRLPPEHRGDAHLWPYLVFACALGALQIVMQQVRFELFSTSPELVILTVAGVLALGWFVRHQWRHPKPLMRLHALRERTFQAGMALYVCYYYMSNALGYLVSRFLEGGLRYPVENAGRLTGLTSLASVAAAFVYFRYSARVTHKKWMIVPGFLLAALIGVWMIHMPPDASMAWIVPPLVARGLLLLFIALPTANVTFRIFAIEEFHNGYRFKNILKQLTYSFATATMIILEQHRLAVHQTRLIEYVTPLNPLYRDTFDALSRAFEGAGHAARDAQALALAEIGRMVSQQASFLSALDGFYFIAGIAVVAGVFAVWQKQID